MTSLTKEEQETLDISHTVEAAEILVKTIQQINRRVSVLEAEVEQLKKQKEKE
jgi:uncharacterized small protein (DUF1192 family)